ncbi:hypothetical protein ACFW4O_23140 [Streptomyces mutabilis]|uniref:hypothetical protein n=1 Tax=Streptomyces TaxID=1883 RepID=UPI00117D7BFE|nr:MULTISPECIES: hypothetical protein [unclassified Streptomyces]MDQ0390114.1 hypothetical protein [Streptomyces sp. DSM 42143]
MRWRDAYFPYPCLRGVWNSLAASGVLHPLGDTAPGLPAYDDAPPARQARRPGPTAPERRPAREARRGSGTGTA